MVTKRLTGIGPHRRVAALLKRDLGGLDLEGICLHGVQAEIASDLGEGGGRHGDDECGRSSVFLQHTKPQISDFRHTNWPQKPDETVKAVKITSTRQRRPSTVVPEI
jgi:hypothetical protein